MIQEQGGADAAALIRDEINVRWKRQIKCGAGKYEAALQLYRSPPPSSYLIGLFVGEECICHVYNRYSGIEVFQW